jgi:hypothetical protein
MDNTTVTFICNPNPGGWSVSWSGGNTVATYSHNSFTENTNYTFRITGGKDAAGNKLIASTVPNPWVFSTLDNSPPTIIATTPVNGTIDVELDAKIVVTFSEPMNTASVTHTCSPDPGGWVITWGKSSTRATFTHNSFNSTTKYTFQVTSGKDLSGNPMVLGTTPNPWIFTTRDAIGPTIISVSPQNEAVEVVRAANIVVTFSEQINTSTVTYTCSPNPSGWSVVWSAGNTVATFMHDPFERSTSYTFQITSCLDPACNNLASGNVPNPWSFTTITNIPPTILSSPITTATEEIPYNYDIEAFDPNNDILTYTLITQPTGMTIENTNGKIYWTPTNAQVGVNPVVVLVTDGYGGATTQAYNITVININDPPMITSVPVKFATEDALYTYQVEAMDIDESDVLTFSLPNAPTEMLIDSSTGLISWVPTNDDVGSNPLIVQVEDGSGGSDSQSFIIIVNNTNDPPEITSTPEQTATEDDIYSYFVEAYDVDVGDKLTYGLTTQPDDMVIDKVTGLLTWTPNNDQVGIHSVVVSVRDDNSGITTQTFTISVINVNDPPVITSAPENMATEKSLYIYDVLAIDIDPTDDVLTYSLLSNPEGMEINSKSGAITWTPTNEQIGLLNIEVQVQDNSGGKVSQMYILRVANVNDPPVITSIPVTNAVEDRVYTYDVDAVDVDADEVLTYDLEEYPDGMIIDTNTGMLTWVPTNAQVGVTPVTVKVTDSHRGSAKQTFMITVANLNDVPEITSSPNTQAITGVEYVTYIEAKDIDPTDDDLTFSLTKSPKGMVIDQTNGIITWIPAKDQGGPTEVMVTVSDGNDGTTSQTYLVDVETYETPGSEPAERQETQQSVYYSILGFIIILIIIFFSILGLFLKGLKSKVNEEGDKEQKVINQLNRNITKKL